MGGKSAPLDQLYAVRDECWPWLGRIASNGYGQYRRHDLAHRAVYEALVGSIPEGLHIDHLCRNRWCVRPDHLEPVTQAENNRRSRAGEVNGARQRALTHCKRNHEFTPENTYVGTGGRRVCRTCKREWMAAKRAAQR